MATTTILHLKICTAKLETIECLHRMFPRLQPKIHLLHTVGDEFLLRFVQTLALKLSGIHAEFIHSVVAVAGGKSSAVETAEMGDHA
jgi:hypothetical protein